MKYALFALAVYTPFEEFLLKWVPVDLYFYARFGHYGFILACFAVIWLRRLVEGRPLWIRTPLDVPLLIFLVVSAVSTLRGVAPVGAATLNYQPLLRFVVLAFYLVQYIDFDTKDAKRLLMILYGVAFIECVIALLQSAIGPSASSFLAPRGVDFMGHMAGRMTQIIFEGPTNIFGTVARYNVLGLFLGIFLVFSVPFYQDRKNWRPAFRLFYVVAIPCLVLSVSRSGWLATAAGLFTIWALKKQLKFVVVSLAIALALLVAINAFPDYLRFYNVESVSPLRRLLEPFSAQYFAAHSHYSRVYFIFFFPFEVLSHSVERFLLGFGPGSLGFRAENIFNLYPLSVIGVPEYNHHYVVDVNWAFIFGQTGLIGLSCFLWGLFRLFKKIVCIHMTSRDAFLNNLALGVVGLFALFAVGGFLYNVMEVRPLSLYFWLFSGVAVKLGHQEKLSAGSGTDTL